MDALPAFMRDTYIIKPDNRIAVKEIYEDFRAWYVEKYGASEWNNITQRQVYAILKSLPDYAYVRYREGYCLKGIAYKLPIKQVNKIETPSEINAETQQIQHTNLYLTLNIVKPQLPTTVQPVNTGKTINNIISPIPNNHIILQMEPIRLDVVDVREYKIERLAPRVPKIVLPRAFQSAALNIKK